MSIAALLKRSQDTRRTLAVEYVKLLRLAAADGKASGERLLEVARDLSLSPEVVESDLSVIAQAARLEARVKELRSRLAEGEPRLHAAAEHVRECERQLAAARAARADLLGKVNSSLLGIGEVAAELDALRRSNPRLWGSVEA